MFTILCLHRKKQRGERALEKNSLSFSSEGLLLFFYVMTTGKGDIKCEKLYIIICELIWTKSMMRWVKGMNNALFLFYIAVSMSEKHCWICT